MIAETVKMGCCGGQENEGYEDENNPVMCYACKEWTSVVRCEECHEVIFESSCCG